MGSTTGVVDKDLTADPNESKIPMPDVPAAKAAIEKAIKTTTTRDLIPAQEMQDTLLEIYLMLQSEQVVSTVP